MKTYHNLRVPWHTHLYRAGLSLFLKSDKPWYTHVYRAGRSFTRDPRYCSRINKPNRTAVPIIKTSAQAARLAESISSKSLHAFEAARREAGV